MRAAAAVVLAVLGVAACGPGKGVDPSQYSGLPPQDTLTGGYAPAPSTASGGSVAVPANPNAPPSSGGTALTWESVPPAPSPGTAPAAGGTPAAPGRGSGATGATASSAAGGR